MTALHEPASEIIKTEQSSPGPLRSEASLEIQTREAQKLVVGRQVDIDSGGSVRKVEHIVGLHSFGRRMGKIWVAAQHDDPFADWYLLQVETALNTAKITISAKNIVLSQLMDGVNAIKIKTSQSINPVSVDLHFSNPYGYIAAYLIAEFDSLACTVLTASHIGLIDRSLRTKMMESASKLIRKAFLLSAQWRFTGVTRAAIRADEMTAQTACDLMGELPNDHLELKLRAKIAPEIRTGQSFVLPRQEAGQMPQMLKVDS
jgi:integrating conjugative element protein (TIGR03761 family)